MLLLGTEKSVSPHASDASRIRMREEVPTTATASALASSECSADAVRARSVRATATPVACVPQNYANGRSSSRSNSVEGRLYIRDSRVSDSRAKNRVGNREGSRQSSLGLIERRKQ